jgi:hypothetical protein
MTDVSIKETKEAIAALKTGVVLVKKVVKGGIAAAPAAVLEAASKAPIFIEGYKGADQIKAELSNLDKAEIIELFVSVFDGVKEVEQA